MNFFKRNALVATLLTMAFSAFSFPSTAATPTSGTISTSVTTFEYQSGPFLISNPSGTASLICAPPLLACDNFALTVNLPAGYEATHPLAVVRVSTVWSNTTEDYDLYVLDSAGATVGSSASGGDPEVATIAPRAGVYTVQIVPFTAVGGTTMTTITLDDGSGGPPPPPPPTGSPPRFQLFSSPDGFGDTAGEPSIGYNNKSKRAMFIAALQTLRVTFPEAIADPVPLIAGQKLPESCDANWEDVSYLTTSLETLDPILFTDSKFGRTFVSQLTGANSLFAYTDDDGANWTPGQIGPPNGGVDHQTVGTGPYPAGSPFASIAQAAGVDFATYYCSQSIVASFCARSDTGGLVFGPGIPIKTAVDCGGAIGALHGHVRVAPDGTVYVPDKSCSNKQVAIVSEDSGLTWKVRPIPDSTPGPTDPQMALATDGTGYFCYIDGSGRPKAAVTHNKGSSWDPSYDLGASVGVVSAVFSQGIAGDPNRASCAFIGTGQSGNSSGLDFTGVWYAYVATTYDGGHSWATVNVTPNDPVQGQGGICTSGTTCGTNRNLLDFNEITLDERGRVLFGFADGCVGACVQDPSQNSFAANGVIARMNGGRSLFASFDPPKTTSPKAACLTGARTAASAHLSWRAPDNGGNPISNYRVYRGLTPEKATRFVGDAGQHLDFEDRSADPNVPTYYYRIRAMNAKGAGARSNVVSLPISTTETSCLTPGITVARDASDDSVSGLPGQELLLGSVAEPPTLPGKFVVTLKVASLANLPPSTQWLAVISTPAGDKFVEMTTEGVNALAPAFKYGDVGVVDGGATTVTTYTTVGSLDPASGYSPDGTITLVVPASVIGSPAVGTTFNFLARVRLVTDGGVGSPGRLIDESSAGGYTVRGTAICAPNTAPIAALTSNTQTGKAPKLVKFDGSGSSDSDVGDSVMSYHFSFGDGSAPVTQGSPKLSHVYNSAGSFGASLTVTDIHGLVSSNTAERVITIKP